MYFSEFPPKNVFIWRNFYPNVSHSLVMEDPAGICVALVHQIELIALLMGN